MSDVTHILWGIEQGDAQAAERLLPLVYEELRRLAAHRLAHEKPGQTLQATALVHEAYLRLVDVEKAQHWNSRRHFFAAAAEAMRRILIEAARRKKRLRHGGDLQKLPLADVHLADEIPIDDVLAVDEALTGLAEADEQTAELVKLHYFAGLTIEQAAQTLGISSRTAYRNWAYARAWLFRHLSREEPPDSH